MFQELRKTQDLRLLPSSPASTAWSQCVLSTLPTHVVSRILRLPVPRELARLPRLPWEFMSTTTQEAISTAHGLSTV